MLDSLVRVSRRVGRVPEAEASPTGAAVRPRPSAAGQRDGRDGGRWVRRRRTAPARAAPPTPFRRRCARVRYRRAVRPGLPGPGRREAARPSAGALGRRPTGRDVPSGRSAALRGRAPRAARAAADGVRAGLRRPGPSGPSRRGGTRLAGGRESPRARFRVSSVYP